MFYCGFSGDFCGQSNIDDVNPKTSIIILAFLNTSPDGSAIIDGNNFPTSQVKQWKSQGKIVVLSVGGQNGNWATVFSSSDNTIRFINSLLNHVRNYEVDGVDLDIESYLAPPRVVANMIIELKTQLMKTGKKYVIVSPEDVTVYQGTPVPNPDQAGQPFNYFVPIIQLADNYIDFYQPQAYNNWYDGLPGGSLDYLKDVYLNWRNYQGLSPWAGPIPNFKGVSGKKLLIGLLASSRAGGAAYYTQP
jgi:chitinase